MITTGVPQGGIRLNSYYNTTQISTHPRATQQGRVKCWCHVTVPAVPTQEAILEEGG